MLVKHLVVNVKFLSGLVKYMTEEEMLNEKIIVVENLKPSALRGETSYGMVMCASAKNEAG
eukprot:UN07419